MEKHSGLILPVATETHQALSGPVTLTKVEFSDGTLAAQIDFDPYRDLVVSDAEGVISKPDRGRYPFTEHVARLVLRHYDEHGKFPDYLSK